MQIGCLTRKKFLKCRLVACHLNRIISLMNNVKYVTSDTVDQLANDVTRNVNWYYNRTEVSETSPLFHKNQVRKADLEIDSLKNKLVVAGALNNRNEHDAVNSYIVFQALKNLAPHQATDERLWVYLCHTDCKEYATSRWTSRTIPADSRKVQKEIAHFFVPSKSKARNLFRGNAISRLWWMGYLAHQIDPNEPKLCLEILLDKQDIAVQILTRSFTQNRQLLKSIYEFLKKDWLNGKEIFSRNVFRKWMSKIDIYGGVVLLDALSEEQLRKILIQFAKEALEA